MSGRLWTALVALACLTAPAQASSALVAAGDALPIPAWTELCQDQPHECVVDRAEPERITLTEDTRILLSAVNQYVNRSIMAVSDSEHWGVADRWNLPSDGRGDCEDYQLLKRKFLAEAGVPRRALRMTVVLDRLGQGHAVLMVRTSDGDLILDNLTDAVLVWSETGHHFIKRESQDRAGWVYLQAEPQRALVALAR